MRAGKKPSQGTSLRSDIEISDQQLFPRAAITPEWTSRNVKSIIRGGETVR